VALSALLKQKTPITGCGRTDAGVHASQFFFHFDFEGYLDKEKLKFKLNSFLPEDIAIFRVINVKGEAHARFSAISRSYQYRMSLGKNVFQNELSFVIPGIKLDLDLMNQAGSIIMEYSDFKCFSKSKTDVKTYECVISEACWKQDGADLTFHITGNRFLRNMVRAIVGTMIEIGKGKMTLKQFRDVIESRDRTRAGASVKAWGLYLSQVSYPNEIFIQ